MSKFDIFKQQLQCVERDTFLKEHLEKCVPCQKQLAFLLQEIPFVEMILGKEAMKELKSKVQSLMEKPNGNVQDNKK